MTTQVAIIDYGMSNLDSICRAVQECGGDAIITDQKSDILKCTHFILPGVGAFPTGMAHLKERHLDELLYEQVVQKDLPLLGVCLGMQLLAEAGDEVTPTAGLGWIPGHVRKMEVQPGELLPHMGWNEVRSVKPDPLFDDIAPGSDFYFVHSFTFRPTNAEDILATTPYAGGIVSAVRRGMLWGVQFHPEKSQRVGFKLLTRFIES